MESIVRFPKGAIHTEKPTFCPSHLKSRDSDPVYTAQNADLPIGE